MKVAHLARRFVRALWPGRPRPSDRRWVMSILEPAELELWQALPHHDQRYSVRVARWVESSLAGSEYAGDARWLAAALLHDVGKLDAGLGVFGRVTATTIGAVVSRSRVDRWLDAPGLRGRIARYLCHDDLGAARLRSAGARPEAVGWARAHHRRERWPGSGVPEIVAEALEHADNA